MTTGAWVLLAAVAAALAVGLWRLRSDGRFAAAGSATSAASDRLRDAGEGDVPRGPSVVETPPPAAGLVASLDAELGERATLLQFSSAFCAPCRATRQVLSDVAGVVPGVAHVEVDAEHHLAAVRRLEVSRTPTTLVLDPTGREISRASGAPRKEQVLSALAGAVADVHDVDAPSDMRDDA